MAGLRVENAIDMHCHFGPDTFCEPHSNEGHAIVHSVTAFEAAREAHLAGYRGLVLKSHSFASPSVAFALAQAVPGLQVFGGICTDHPSGGLNLSAVEAALRLGGKIVWLPTVHSHQDYLDGKGEAFGIQGTGITVFDNEGQLLNSVREIFALVQQHEAVLATGHITALEHYAVVKEFAQSGKVLVTHAGEELGGPKLSPRQCKELADLGATIELTALSCNSVWGCRAKSALEMANMISEVGYESCTLSSDYGWSIDVPRPASGFRGFLERLWEVGVPEAEIVAMASSKPAALLGI